MYKNIFLQTYFQHFSTSIKEIELPKKFTFPFYYEPHQLSKIATEELQNYLENQTDFEHNFGLGSCKKGLEIGKMFGVLVVENSNNEIGYIAAVSGKLANTNHHKKFVPPVFNMLTKDSYFLKEEELLNSINHQIKTLEKDINFIKLKEEFKKETKKAKIDIKEKKIALKEGKRERDLRREKAQSELKLEAYADFEEALSKESLEAKYFFNNVTRFWEHTLNNLEEKLSVFTNKIDALKAARKTKSAALQTYLFSQYQFLNSKKEAKNLSELFEENPPAGSGECAAPKLLQYAFSHDLKPIAMAEFWWGKSPNTEIRKRKYFYPACQGKCKPILTHMLNGIDMDTNPMLQNPAIGKEIEIIFEDEDILVIHKPAEFLSVPGIHIQDSVYTRIKQQFPSITGPIIVHRLDMSTSGLLVLAKHKKAHKNLQHQFTNRTVNKKYVALLDGNIKESSGEINLPLRVDLNDRPRQLVCFEHGKIATTKWQIVERKNNTTRINLFPITGRTHQLRVHVSHSLGLNRPIIGDDLYGKKANRLHLHAAFLEFEHPTTKEKISFHKKAEF